MITRVIDMAHDQTQDITETKPPADVVANATTGCTNANVTYKCSDSLKIIKNGEVQHEFNFKFY